MIQIRIVEIEAYFKSVELPKEIRLNDWTYITNVPKMIESHLEICKHNHKNHRFDVYYERLVELKNKIGNIIQ